MQSKRHYVPLSEKLELLRILPPPQAEEVTSLSWDTIKRRYPEKVRKLSPRREGITVGDALSIGKPDA
jgi:hypothetical protein